MTIIKYEAEWCSPCQAYKPIFNKVMEDYKQIKAKIIDIDEEPEMAQKYGVRSVPTTLLLDDNDEELTRIVGKVNEETLRKFIDES